MLLPGHLLLKFLKEQLETALESFKGQVRRKKARHALWVGFLFLRVAGCRCRGMRLVGWLCARNFAPVPSRPAAPLGNPPPPRPRFLSSFLPPPQVLRDLEQRPEVVNLQDEQYVKKTAERMQDVVS